MSVKTYFNWSTGKDSALALHHLLKDSNFLVEKLVTTVNSHYNRVTMHGLPFALLKKQTEAIGIPLQTINLPEQPSMEDYETIMAKAINSLKAEGFTHSVFGDIFLEDLKQYRENKLSNVGIQAVFHFGRKTPSN